MPKVLLEPTVNIDSNEDPLFLVIDLFAGAGGTTTGFVDAELPTDKYSRYYVGSDFKASGFKKFVKVIACVNHDAKAIKSHWLNHPEVVHFEEDIRTVDVRELAKLVNYYRQKYPKALVILWASLECTNFSKAKGGLPREADSRTLAQSLYMVWDKKLKEYVPGDSYIQMLNPDYIQIENVVEFMSWGPLDDRGKPVSRRNGCDWLKWREEIKNLGYKDDWQEMNSANFGAYTSRNRLFGCFAKKDLPIIWPEATHAKTPEKNSLYNTLEKWKPVKDVLNFENEGNSIFDTLTKKTKKSAIKYLTPKRKGKNLVTDNAIVVFPNFISTPQFGMEPKLVLKKNKAGDPQNIEKSIAEFCFENKIGIDDVSFYYHSPYSEKTLGRILAGLIKFIANGDKAFISKYYNDGVKGGDCYNQGFLMQTYAANSKGDNTFSIDNPGRTVTTRDSTQLVQTKFLDVIYGNGYPSSVESPAPTIRTKDGLAIVDAKFFIDKHFGKFAQNQSLDVPAGTIMPNDKHRLVECVPFIFNPSHGGHSISVDNPCPVIVARQDKAPLSVVSIISSFNEDYFIPVFSSDSETLIQIKHFMAMYGIEDIKIRMLMIEELLEIQGFPEGYKLYGTQGDRKKFIGNSVVPVVVKKWIEALATKTIELGLFLNAA